MDHPIEYSCYIGTGYPTGRDVRGIAVDYLYTSTTHKLVDRYTVSNVRRPPQPLLGYLLNGRQPEQGAGCSSQHAAVCLGLMMRTKVGQGQAGIYWGQAVY